MNDPLRVLAFAGSLRAGSTNRALVRAAVDLAPDGVTVEPFDLAEIPLYNADLDTDDFRPEPVARFKAAIAASDALLIATPEYNHSVPGVLQNAIDWASRPGFSSPMVGKPVGVVGAAGGAIGTARAQQKLQNVLLSVLAHPFPHRGVLVGRAREKVEDGQLTDEATRDFLAGYLEGFTAFARRFR